MSPARAKVEAERVCRVCGCGGADRLDAAHLWDRSLGGPDFDDPDAIVPLCSRIKGGGGCHDAYDNHRLDLLPYLRLEEQLALVKYAGGIERARNRAIGAEPRRVETDVWGPY